MKKNTMILTAIGLLATIGGLVAGKLNHRAGSWYCTSTTTTINPDGTPVTCSVRGTTGLAGMFSGRCGTMPTTGNYPIITRWSPNQ